MGRDAVARDRAGALFLAAAVAITILDQASKAIVRARIAPLDTIPLVRGLVYLTHVRNQGAAFGMMPGGRWLFVLTSLGVLAGVAVYWLRAHPGPFVSLSLGLVAGGAAGNLYDRLVTGLVTDFVDVHVFPVFNVADSAIVVGVALLLWHMFFVGDEAAGGDEPVGDARAPEDTDEQEGAV